MAYNIVKLENGNVALYDSGSGDFLKSISPDYVEIECNVNGVVKLIQDNGNVEYFLPADVANTQVLPAAAVPFAGTCADLAELLATDFFFEVAGGGLEWQYNKSRPQNFVPVPFTPVTAGAGADIMRFFPIVIREDLEITEIGINITAGAVGNLVAGLYESVEGIPTNLIFQSTAFDTNVTGVQTYTLPAAVSIKKGVYFKATNASSNPTMSAIPIIAHDNILGCLGASGNIQTEGRYNLVYTGTLPAVAGSITNRFTVNSLEILFTIS